MKTRGDFVTVWHVQGGCFLHLLIKHHRECRIDWGDGRVEALGSSGKEVSHLYENTGQYEVRINNKLLSVTHNSQGSKLDCQPSGLLELKQWGTARWESCVDLFYNAKKMVCTATDTPNFSRVKNFSYMFYCCHKFNSPVNNWNVSNGRSFNSMFAGAHEFNQPMDKWDMRKALVLVGMFIGALKFNQPIAARWQLDSVQNIAYVLENTPSFKQDVSLWKEANHEGALHVFSYQAGLDSYLERYNIERDKDTLLDLLL